MAPERSEKLMSKNTQLLEDVAYLESIGMTLDQLRSLHHWAGRPGSEERVTFNSARDYFGREHEMGVNNSLFADRLNFVAKAQKQAAVEACPVDIGTLVEQAVRGLPGSAVEPT